MLLGPNCVLLPSFFAFPHRCSAPSFAGLFRGNLEFGHFHWELAYVSILLKCSIPHALGMAVISETWSMKEKDGLLLQRR